MEISECLVRVHLALADQEVGKQIRKLYDRLCVVGNEEFETDLKTHRRNLYVVDDIALHEKES